MVGSLTPFFIDENWNIYYVGDYSDLIDYSLK